MNIKELPPIEPCLSKQIHDSASQTLAPNPIGVFEEKLIVKSDGQRITVEEDKEPQIGFLLIPILIIGLTLWLFLWRFFLSVKSKIWGE